MTAGAQVATPVEVSLALRAARVVPVLVVPDGAPADVEGTAVGLVGALADGGLPVAEITLRTAAGLAAISAARDARPDVVVGAGTVLAPRDVDAAVAAGAQFLVSPGTTPELLAALLRAQDLHGVLALPGCATASEAMVLRAAGVRLAKYFPAEAAGGPRALSALAGPLHDLTFCATGGITRSSAPDYLALPNVPCVGGSWMAPAAAVRDRDWATVTALSAESAALQTA